MRKNYIIGTVESINSVAAILEHANIKQSPSTYVSIVPTNSIIVIASNISVFSVMRKNYIIGTIESINSVAAILEHTNISQSPSTCVSIVPTNSIILIASNISVFSVMRKNYIIGTIESINSVAAILEHTNISQSPSTCVSIVPTNSIILIASNISVFSVMRKNCLISPI